MTRILLVDDERMIRKAIAKSIDWQKHGVQIVADVANGEEALLVMGKEVIDIVITDIRMPVMDGLKLSEAIKEQYPKTRVIILSGYDDFEYARTAIKQGVQDYLLKPVSEEELIPSIRRLEKEIGSEHEHEREMFLSKKMLQENKVLICTKVIQDIVNGRNGGEIMLRAQKLGMNLAGPLFGVILVSADDYNVKYNSRENEQPQLQRFAIYNVFDELFRERIPSTTAYSGEEDVITIFSARHFMKTRMYEVLGDISKTIEEVLGVTVSMAVSGGIGEMKDIQLLYKEAKDASKQNFYAGKNQIRIGDKEDERKEPSWRYLRADYERDFMNELKKGDREGNLAAWQKIAHFFENESTSAEVVKDTCIRLCKDMFVNLIDLGIRVKDEENSGDEDYYCFSNLQKKKFFTDVSEYMEDIIGDIHEKIAHANEKKYSYMVRSAMSYIELNFGKDISLTEVADEIGVSANYFSKIFKKEVGTNFVDWLNQLRIDKAKDILKKRAYKVYEVAEMVGYSEYKYFITMFKKYTGKTPKQFREKGDIL